ncbi:MAG: hypothetical protein F6K17_07420 [Okeania sp. SIO3C4]|nr:hypothetical protein [Okeania sp. SIO3C4]
MPSDLNDLMINQKDLKKLTGIAYDIDDPPAPKFSLLEETMFRPSSFQDAKVREKLYQDKYKFMQFIYGFFPVSFVFFTVVNYFINEEDSSGMQRIFESLFLSMPLSIILGIPFAALIMPVTNYIGSLFITKSAKRKWKQQVDSLQPTPLGALIDEAINYNKVVKRFIKNVKVIDQLKEAGNPVEIKDRDKVIQAFRKIKSDLERALKTEKILRENPDFKPEEFSIDLTFLRAVKFEEKAQTYAEFVNDAIDIGLRVQEEMKNLQNWS